MHGPNPFTMAQKGFYFGAAVGTVVGLFIGWGATAWNYERTLDQANDVMVQFSLEILRQHDELEKLEGCDAK